MDLEHKIYKKCYETCNKCNFIGDRYNNNCTECKTNYEFYVNSMNISNCYRKCDFYYYFDELNIFYCTGDFICPNKYNKLIINKNKCIDECNKDPIFKFEYNNTCLKECPENTISNENNYYCIEKTNSSFSQINNLLNINFSNIKNPDIILKKFQDLFIFGFDTTYIDEGNDFFLLRENLIYTI